MTTLTPFIPAITAVFCGASAVWVYWDATRHKIGKVKGQKGFFNISAGAWGIVTFALWIVAFPAYLLKRRALIEQAKQHPVEVSGRGFKMTALGVVTVLNFTICLPIFRSQEPPRCDAPNVMSAVNGIANDLGHGNGGVRSPSEASYSSQTHTRRCHGTWISDMGDIPIIYSIEPGNDYRFSVVIDHYDLDHAH